MASLPWHGECPMSNRILVSILVAFAILTRTNWADQPPDKHSDKPAAAAAEPKPVHFVDDFSTNTLKDYEIKGDVAWEKGSVKLGKDAQLTRKVKLGHTAEITA